MLTKEMQDMVDATPADYRPPQPEQKKPEEIPLGALPEEVAKVLRAAHFGVDQALQEVAKHNASKDDGSHTQESCAESRKIVLDFTERLTDLRKHVGDTLRAHFNLTSTDEFGIRAEGVVLLPPTPPDPLEQVAAALREHGVAVEIIRVR